MASKSGGKPKSGGTKPDVATWGGLVVALGGIVGGMLLEGGTIHDISQVTAAMIVLGGTFGAVMVTTPLAVILSAVKKLKLVFFEQTQTADAVIDELITFATKARKNGIVSLEQDADAIQDPFLKKALNLAIDGMDLKELRNMMELEITLEEQHAEAEVKVFEAAGGYSPTIGIIGAVLGLIQVMKNLENIEEVGRGIAVAFVATVYGVGVANLLLLPAGAKIRARMSATFRRKELMLEGVVGIVEGLNPKLIRSKLEAYVKTTPKPKAAKSKQSAEQAGEPAPASS